MSEPADDATPATRVRVRRPADPLAPAETIDVSPEAAPHWADRVWHERPPR